AWFIAAEEGIGRDPRRAHQREHQRAIGNVVAGKAAIEQGDAPYAVAAIHPMLSREFLLNGPFDRTERNLVKPPAALDRSREQDPIAHKLVLIQNPRLDVNAADARVESDRGREAAIAERVGNAEFGKK